MKKHELGIRELAEVLTLSPPKGRTHPDQAYSVSLHFRSVALWRSAVEQYGARIQYENQQGDGHYMAVRKFGDIDRRPYAFAGAELQITHVADTE